MNQKVGPNDGFFHVRYYKCPRIFAFLADVDDAFTVAVGIDSSVISGHQGEAVCVRNPVSARFRQNADSCTRVNQVLTFMIFVCDVQ